MGGPILCSTQQLHFPFADTSDNKSIIHTLSLKEGFFVGCIYIRKRG